MKISRFSTSIALFALSTTFGVAVAKEPCSIKPSKATKNADLPSLAKVTKEQAQATAIASLAAGSKPEVKDAELEVEHGCLLWSFDLKIAGKDGVQEVQVDAGNGKVLSSKSETPKQEKAEAAKDRAKAPKV